MDARSSPCLAEALAHPQAGSHSFERGHASAWSRDSSWPCKQQRSRDAVRLDLNQAASLLVLAGWAGQTGFGQCDMQCGCHVTTVVQAALRVAMWRMEVRSSLPACFTHARMYTHSERRCLAACACSMVDMRCGLWAVVVEAGGQQ